MKPPNVEEAPQLERAADTRKAAVKEPYPRPYATPAADLRDPQREGLTEQRTEIHISIGSIELRAPRSEARPQPAPFRPSVSLDDFLRRDRGART